MKVKVLVSQSCLTLCDPMDGSPPGSSVHGISQARILTGVGCHSFFQGGLPNPGSEPGSPALQADSLLSEAPGKPFSIKEQFKHCWKEPQRCSNRTLNVIGQKLRPRSLK